MKTLRFLTGLFAASFVFIFIFYPFSTAIAGIFAILSAVFLAACLARFVDSTKRKKKGSVKIEEVTFGHSFLFRSFFKPRDLWVKYDKNEKRFRPADFRDMPIEVGFLFLLGTFLLYTSYLIMSTLFEAPNMIPLRASFLVVIFVLGFYIFSVSIARIVALLSGKNKEASKLLNRNRKLRGFARSSKAYIEVTPSFTLDGFVTSVEFVTKHKYDTSKTEKLLLEVSRELNK
ncbi:MAG: hypothetical protein V1818_04265 [Candidatus Aenigmatarchaeota archaeon]